MKKAIFFLPALLLLTIFSNAQEDNPQEIRTLFGGEFTNGGYGSFDMKVSPVNKDIGLLTGGKGGWIINHKFVIGGAGYGLTTNSTFTGPSKYGTDTTLNIGLGYGGLLFEYILKPTDPIHLAFPIIIGAGGAGIYENKHYDSYGPDYNYSPIEHSAFVIIEPGADIQFNMVKYFRMSFGVSYRMILGSDMNRLSDSDLSGLSFQIAFKFGLF